MEKVKIYKINKRNECFDDDDDDDDDNYDGADNDELSTEVGNIIDVACVLIRLNMRLITSRIAFVLSFHLDQKCHKIYLIRELVKKNEPDVQQCGILTCVDSDKPLQLLFKLINSKWCSVSTLTVIEYSSN